MSPLPEREPNKSTYGGLVAARIRELRRARGWTIEQLAERLEEAGATVRARTLYTYEVGKESPGGADLPMHLVPYFARAFGFKSPAGFLPPFAD